MGRMQKVMSFALAAAAIVTTPARATCWQADEVSAAKIRDMETMLMVAALRCHGGGDALLADYNAFVRGSRSALVTVNSRLQSHFAAAVGPAQALNAYDRYVTSIANQYGAGAEGLSCRDMGSILSAARSEAGSYEGLTRLADNAGVMPKLSGGKCAISFANAK